MSRNRAETDKPRLTPVVLYLRTSPHFSGFRTPYLKARLSDCSRVYLQVTDGYQTRSTGLLRDWSIWTNDKSQRISPLLWGCVQGKLGR